MLFAVLTGFTMDYLTPLPARRQSFKEFMQEWILDQFQQNLQRTGLSRPWYWDRFVASIDWFHHMIYASAYTYRATVWFHFVVPGPEERAWLREKYPGSWPELAGVWDRIVARWQACPPGVDLGVHGTAIVGFCNLCLLVLSQGTPERNEARTFEHAGRKYVFCSEVCQWIFSHEPERYAAHMSLVDRVLAGQAPGNLLELLTRTCDLRFETWGKDARAGDYPWLQRVRPA